MELITAAGSFLAFHFVTHPKSKINKKLPNKKFVKRVSVFPRISIEAKNKVFHVHHWMIFSSLYLYAQHSTSGFWSSSLLHGILIGGIAQGLMFADRFKFVFNTNEYKKVQKTSYNLSFLKKLI